MTVSDATTAPVAVGLIGAGAIGAFHAETLARRLPGARLVGVADPAPGAAERLASSLGAPKATTDPAELLADPAVEAVLIAAPARFHADLVVAAAGAGKAVFCEKPMALTLADADRAIAAALEELGYRGTVGLEAWASGDSEQALTRFRDAFTRSDTSEPRGAGQ